VGTVNIIYASYSTVQQLHTVTEVQQQSSPNKTIIRTKEKGSKKVRN